MGLFISFHGRSRRRWIDESAVIENFADLATIEGFVLKERLGDCHERFLALG